MALNKYFCTVKESFVHNPLSVKNRFVFYCKVEISYELTLYNGLYGELPPERGTFFRLQVYKRVGISQVEVYKRVGQSVI